MRHFLKVLALALVSFFAVSFAAQAQGIERVSKVTNYHSTVGTTTALAIPGASVGGNVIGFKICNDAINTSTYLLVGQAVDAATDGTMLAPGACFVCESCKPAILKAMNVKGQAAANGYSVIQYRQ